MIPEVEYKNIMSLMPLLCVDGVLIGPDNKFLLVKRNNEPLKGSWWVPGGRVLKGETLEDAFIRKMQEEVGIDLNRSDIDCLGFFEATSMAHDRTEDGVLHSVSIVFSANIEQVGFVLDDQSTEFSFFDELPAEFNIRAFSRGF
jgi:colanic acid biosynthesis protein WcaH